MNELTEGVSWIGVMVSFVLSYALGWLWYSSKMFGKKWAKGSGIDFDSGKSMPAFAMITQALGTFTLAWLFGITAARNALLTIILILVMLILFVVSAGKYVDKSNTALVIEGAYILAMGLVMFICQGIF